MSLKSKFITILASGLVLLFAGTVLAWSFLSQILGGLGKGYSLYDLNLDYGSLGRAGVGIIMAIAGLLILFIGLLRRKSISRLCVFGFLALLVIASSVISYKYVMNSLNNKSETVALHIDPANGIQIEVPYNSSTSAIAKLLKDNGIIEYPKVFKIISKFGGYDGTYQAGTHILKAGLKYEDIMRILGGKPESVKVTIPEGFTFRQIADELFRKKLVDRNDFERTANEQEFGYKFLAALPPRAYKLEGYLFPDTYEFDMNAGEKEIIRRMLDNFNNKFSDEDKKRAEALKMSVDQIITLASIIEREALLDEERQVISGVFYNRLKNKDKTLRRLQSCATIQYIYFRNEGKYKQKITEADTKIPDPYNTYENEGLPPGPICCPGKASIEAALYPEENNYIYFVTKGDGSHLFSKTYKEHLAAIKKYGAY